MDTLKVMNVVNFVRGCEPRIEVDLVEPIKKQLELLEENGLKSTFLLQYDALLRKDMTDLFADKSKRADLNGAEETGTTGIILPKSILLWGIAKTKGLLS